MVPLPMSPLMQTVLGALGHEPRIAAVFATWTLARDPEVAREAAALANHYLRELPPRDVLWLEQHRREYGPPDPRREAWEALRPADLAQFEAFGAARTALFCLLAIHPSGHVRQASIERLANVRDGVEVPFLLARLNDWVGPVRVAAKAAVMARIAGAQKGDLARGRELLANLSLFDRLRGLGRDDHAPIRKAFEAMLVHPAFAPVLVEGMRSPRHDVRFRCFTKALERPEEDARAVLSQALADRDASIRLWAARAALKRLAGDELCAAVETMRRDRSASVRNEGVFALATKIEPPDREALEHALLDTSASVRWTARHYLAERWKIDARRHYLRALAEQDPSRVAAAIAGLAECGNHPDDSARALALRDHQSAAVRKAALLALARGAGDKHVEELFAALRDERASVAREATWYLKERIDRLDPAQIQRMIREAPHAHSRRMAVRLATYLEPERSLGLLLEALLDAEQVVREEAQRSLAPWVWRAGSERTFFAPEEQERLHSAIEAARHVLETSIAGMLSDLVRRPPR